MSRRLKLVLVLSWCVLLAYPLASGGGSGSDVLGGVTKSERVVTFTFSTFMDGSFQRSFEKRFSRALGIFAPLVRADNELNARLFAQLSSNAKSSVVLGLRGHLIERAYLAAFNREVTPKQSRLESLADQLDRVNRYVRSKGKVFLLIVSPNKPSFYPDVVPSWHRVPDARDKPSGYDRFLPLLKAKGVPVFESDAFLRSIERESPYPLFSPTGTHWSEYAACRASAGIIDALTTSSGKPLTKLACSVTGERSGPVSQDADLLRLANLWFPERLYQPAPRVESSSDSTGAIRPKLLLVGTSFCWELLRNFDRHHVFSTRDFLYYFSKRYSFPSGAVREIDRGAFDPIRELDAVDVVAIEINEAFVHKTGYGFLERVVGGIG